MGLVPVSTAQLVAIANQHRWVELASGVANAPFEEVVSVGGEGDWLPGLGDIWGVGLVDERHQISGVALTRFSPAPMSVSFMLAANVLSQKLNCIVLQLLFGLPRGCLSQFRVRSLARGAGRRLVNTVGEVLRSDDLGALVLASAVGGWLVPEWRGEILDVSGHDVPYHRPLREGGSGAVVIGGWSDLVIDGASVLDWSS